MTGLEINLSGRTAIVTGASGGIGSEIALRFSQAGARIGLHYHQRKPEALLQEITERGGECIAVQADMLSPGFELKLLEKITNLLGQPDILVNCAADQFVADLGNMKLGDFDKVMRTNVSAVFALSRAFANQLSVQISNAAIVNISSIEAARPAKGHGAYATSKAALEMLTKAMALEFGPAGLRVNAIAPGLIERDGIETDWPEGVKRWRDACPSQRLGSGQDIANGAVFLASNMATFINGAVLTIDGGMGATSGW